MNTHLQNLSRSAGLTLVVALLGAAAGFAQEATTTGVAPATPEAAKDIKKQTTCPVMGGAINKTMYVDHDGKRIYACCGGCIAPIKADPAKYIQKLEAEGVTLDKTPQAETTEAPAK